METAGLWSPTAEKKGAATTALLTSSEVLAGHGDSPADTIQEASVEESGYMPLGVPFLKVSAVA